MAFQKLNGDFNMGYTKAIMDFQDILKYIQPDLSHHKKRLTPKLTEELLICFLDNRARVRDGGAGFIRWNRQKEQFEFFIPDRQE